MKSATFRCLYFISPCSCEVRCLKSPLFAWGYGLTKLADGFWRLCTYFVSKLSDRSYDLARRLSPHARKRNSLLFMPAITDDEHRCALQLPPHTIPCLRAGWDIAEEHTSTGGPRPFRVSRFLEIYLRRFVIRTRSHKLERCR